MSCYAKIIKEILQFEMSFIFAHSKISAAAQSLGTGEREYSVNFFLFQPFSPQLWILSRVISLKKLLTYDGRFNVKICLTDNYMFSSVKIYLNFIWYVWITQFHRGEDRL